MLVECLKNGNSGVYDVKFYKKVVNRKTGQQTLNMYCSVSSIDSTKIGKEKYNIIGKGLSRQSIKDKTNKIFGRKLAFSRAIEDFDKSSRIVFWKVFKKNFSI